MIEDGIAAGTTVDCDVCIVGAGPAGISLALRLAARSHARVGLLELGGLAFDPTAQALARGETVGTPYFPLHETRVRALGGSSWSWGGICTPVERIAFEDRPWVADGAWPFPEATLEPYLEEALALCGITTQIRDETDVVARSAFEGAGLDRDAVTPMSVYLSRPTRFGPTYRGRLEKLPNVRLLLHSVATRVEHTEGRVTGLAVHGVGGPFRVRATQYVLAGGGIENPRLLMVAGVGGDTVGRYFMEHPRVVDRFRVRPGATPLGRLVNAGTAGTLRFFRLSLAEKVQRAEELLTYHANLQFGYAGQRSPQWDAVRRLVIATRPPWNESPYFQDAGGGRLRPRPEDLATALRRPDRALLSTLGAVTGRPALRRYLEVWSAVEQAPEHDNRVELVSEPDRCGVPKVRLRWKVGAAEEATYRRSLEVLLAELDKLEPGIAAARIDEGDPWPAHIVGNWHHAGTTRMDDDPAHGVVDRDCRVHGLDNLFVAGSSVFPSSGSTSPTVTILQLALRLGDHLMDRLGPAPVGVTTPSAD